MSAQEELAKPPPRVSPLEYRNTDLVSRLLAATPPYLYNMPIVPNSYFFSELLRSFVHAKSERVHHNHHSGNSLQQQQQPRRARKRSWTQSSTTVDKSDKIFQPPDLKPVYTEDKRKELFHSREREFYATAHQQQQQQQQQHIEEKTDAESSLMSFQPPNPVVTEKQDNLILPPPPPVWYPPLYPTPPYGIDPLHFFIDLRVSGHIYDRNKKVEKDAAAAAAAAVNFISGTSQEPKVSPCEKSLAVVGGFKHRHTSAFSVPNKTNQIPINLSKHGEEHKPLKFDVKSMVEKHTNKTGINYVMSNVDRVYRNLGENGSGEKAEEDKDEEDKARERNLKALIGLELVVDYMAHRRPPNTDSKGENERAESPTLEVVDDISQRDYT